ncbi:MAG: hypothetical protein QM667_02590 [Asticcacaulis sp.]
MALTTTTSEPLSHDRHSSTGWWMLALGVAQIVTSQSPEWFGIGRSVVERSAETSHPLVPLGPAFAIWGVIYVYALVSAVWAIRHPDNRVLKTAGGPMAIIWAMNALWSLWVPLNGIDGVSVILIAISVITGLYALVRLKHMATDRSEQGFVIAPLALVTGWVSAAMVVNLTSALVQMNAMPDPRIMMVSLCFLLVLIAFGGVMTRLTHSLVYATPLIWALGWIAAANMLRQNEPLMAFTALMGMGLILVLMLTIKRRAA